MENFNIKEMYEACLKTTKTMKIGNREFEKGEPFLYFKNLKLESSISSLFNPVIQSGGKNNVPLVLWQDHSEKIAIQVSEGTLDKISFQALTGAGVIGTLGDTLVFKNESLFTNSSGKVTLSQKPCQKQPIFVFKLNGAGGLEKLTDWTLEEKTIQTQENSADVFISYYYVESTSAIDYVLGYKNLNNSFFNFEGKMYYQEESKGENKTCLVKAPRVQILSNMLLKAGAKANPIVANFTLVAFPIEKQKGKTLTLRYLDRDIDGDF